MEAQEIELFAGVCGLDDAIRRVEFGQRAAVTLAASLQIDFATPNILIQEQGITFFGDDFLRYITNPEVFDFHNGYWNRPTGSGLGIDVDEEVVERMAEIGHDRKQPIWWHTDGSYAEF